MPLVLDTSVTKRWLVGTFTFTFEIVPEKISPPIERHPPIVTGPLPITFEPILITELNDESATIVPISAAVNTLL